MMRAIFPRNRTMWQAWALTLIAAGLVRPAPVRGQEVPYVGEITEPKVLVRSFTGHTFYPVGELKQGDRVQVEEVFFAWSKIVPPKGVYSYISRAFVDARGDGTTGVVNADRAAVRAASLEGPADSYRVQLYLHAGDEVKIVGEEGGFYKIEPPKGAFVYLPPGSVRRVTEGRAAAAPDEPAEPTEPQPRPPSESKPAKPQPPAEPETEAKPSVEPPQPAAVAPEPAPVPTPPEQPPAPPAPPPTEAQADPHVALGVPDTAPPAATAVEDQMPPADDPALRDLEQQMKAALQQPLEHQPIERLLGAYEVMAANADLSLHDRRIVTARIAQLRRNRRLVEAVTEAALLKAELQAARRAEAEALEPAGPADYVAVGRLLASNVYDGRHLPRLLRLVEPSGRGVGRTIAYLDPRGSVTPLRLVGKLVGIVGEMHYDPALKLKVIEIEKIDLLEPAAAAATVAPAEAATDETTATTAETTPAPTSAAEESPAQPEPPAETAPSTEPEPAPEPEPFK